MAEKTNIWAATLLTLKEIGDKLLARTKTTQEDVAHLLDLHQMLESGTGGKAVLIERIFEEIEQVRMFQLETHRKVLAVLERQEAMIRALNLPVEPSGR